MKLDKYTVGRRYRKALFELAIDSNKTEETHQGPVSLCRIHEQAPELGNMLSDVRLEPHERREAMDKLISGYDRIVENSLEVVYAYNRMNDLSFMIEEYERRYDEHQDLLLGSVTAAVSLSDEQRIQLRKNVAETVNYQSVKLKQIIDSSIIGDAVAEANH